LALVNGLNHPMGPFKLMDFTGIDLSYYIMNDLEKAGEHHAGYELVKEKFDKGEYGVKSGKGWYEYPSDKEKK
jgi:3-hydroxybutyryl-CoA dehydrogenase